MQQRVRPGRAAAPRGAGRAPEATLVWLASYPKSGNTWTRIFLANYLVAAAEPVPINQVRRFAASDSDPALYRRLAGDGFDPADPVAHLRLRDRALRAIAANGADVNFVKTHNVNAAVSGVRLIPQRYTRAAVYMLRHPLDVAVSYARHFGMTPAQACRSISRPGNTTAGGGANVKQFLGSWSEHVAGWTGATAFPVHVMQYEDMKADPRASFGAMLTALGIPVDDDRLERAIRFSSFDELQRQEAEGGFIEASQKAARFFHSGETGQWSGVLGEDDVAAVRGACESAMRTHGYL